MNIKETENFIRENSLYIKKDEYINKLAIHIIETQKKLDREKIIKK